MRQSAVKAWIWGGAILAGVGVAVLAASATSKPRLREGDSVLVVGDSMAEALAPYLRALALEDGVPLDVLWKRGVRINYWRTRPEFLEALKGKSLVVFVLGTNDQVGAHTASPAEAAELAARTESSGARVAWVGPPTLKQGDDLAGELERVFGREYFDSRDLEIPRAADGLHPSVSGAAGWAAQVWEWLH